MSTAAEFYKKDEQLKNLPFAKYSAKASAEIVDKTKKALEAKKHIVHVVASSKEAVEKIKAIVPKGSSVMNAGSTTLQEIGLVEYLKTQTEWDNWHSKIFAESDPAKQAKLRAEALTADYYFSSVSAVTEDGSLLVCDLTGTRTGAFIQAAGHVVIVIGSNKIVPNLEAARARQNDYCLQLESARVRVAYKVPASQINNSVEITGSNPWGAPGRFIFIIVNESLGF
jgi:L-lactate utilization protein LutB